MRLREAVLGPLEKNRANGFQGKAKHEFKGKPDYYLEADKNPAIRRICHRVFPKGYRLSMIPDILSPEEVKDGLQTQLFGREHYYYFKEIDSTNNYAKTLAADGHPEGTVVIAESQSSGRGRRGRQWYSDSGQGIFLSLILRPPLPVNELSRINMAIALAIVDALQEVGIKSGIKWPNDILIKDRKIAGILTEAITDMDGIEFIVSGIGLNVNTLIEDFPAELPYCYLSPGRSRSHGFPSSLASNPIAKIGAALPAVNIRCFH